GVERLHTLNLVHAANLQMVLQVAADARHVGKHGNLMALQKLGGAKPGKLQQLRRPDTAGTQYDLLAGLDVDNLAIAPHTHARTRQLTIGPPFDLNTLRLGVGPKREVAARHTRRPQKCLGRIPAPAHLLIDLEVPDAFVVALVEIVAGRNARLLRSLGKGIENIPAQPLLLDPPFSAVAVQRAELLARRVVAKGTIGGGIKTVVIFVCLEVRETSLPRPFLIAHQAGPTVVVARLAAHIDHSVDAGTPAQRLATGIAQHPPV